MCLQRKLLIAQRIQKSGFSLLYISQRAF